MPPKKGGKKGADKKGKKGKKEPEEEEKKDTGPPFDWGAFLSSAYDKALSAVLTLDQLRKSEPLEPGASLDQRKDFAFKERMKTIDVWTELEKQEIERKESVCKKIHPGYWHPACRHVTCEEGKCCNLCTSLTKEVQKAGDDLYYSHKDAHWSCCGNKEHFAMTCPHAKKTAE
eukprot:tig00000093_g3509.t1